MAAGRLTKQTSRLLRRTVVKSRRDLSASNTRPADLERFRDFRCFEPLRLHCAHLGGIYRGAPPLVDAAGLGLGDTLEACARGEGSFRGDRLFGPPQYAPRGRMARTNCPALRVELSQCSGIGVRVPASCQSGVPMKIAQI